MGKPSKMTMRVALKDLPGASGGAEATGMRSNRGDLQRSRQVARSKGHREESRLIDAIDMGRAMRGAFREIWPILEHRMRDGDIPKLLDLAAPYAVMTLMNEMLTSKNDKVRVESSKTLAYMAGYQPVQRNLNLEGNLDRMSDEQVTGLIESTFRGMSDAERQLIQQALEKHELVQVTPVEPEEEPNGSK